MAEAPTLNVTDLIDQRAMSRMQIITITICGLVNLLDGLDTQLIAKTLSLPMTSLGLVFSAALFGATLGALSFGPIADRLGRRSMLAFAAFLFGTFTLLTAQASSLDTLLAYRFLAGIGLGGATPCFITLTSEYTPKHLRATAVGVLWSCFPLGGMLGGFLNAWILAHFGWQTVFWVGGSLPFLVGAVVLAYVPESVRFLMANDAPPARVARIITRMFPGEADARTRFTAHEEHIGGISVAHLFMEGRSLSTILLWIPLAMGFGALAVAVLWTPSLLNLAGMSPSNTSVVIAFMGLGGFLGSAAGGRILDKTGLLGGAVPGMILGGIAVGSYGIAAGNIVAISICGMLLNGLISLGMTAGLAMAAALYPTAIRSTGVGWAMGAGRCGQVVAPLLGGLVLGMGWSPAQMMELIAAAPVIGALAMWALHLHTGGQATRAAASS